MFEASIDRNQPKPALYKDVAASLAALLEGETDPLANAANAVSLLSGALDRINWCGIYVLRNGELVLGPFQGKPACVRIALGKGVCGTAAAQRKTLVVPDVFAFPGHIACDGATRSELVIPVTVGGVLVAVLDLDSPHLDGFCAAEARILEDLLAQCFVPAEAR